MGSPSTAAAERPSSRFRAYRRLAGLLLLFAVCVPPHLVAKAFGSSPWPRRFLKWVAWVAGVDARIDGAPASRGTLLLANHVSWLDIPLMAGVAIGAIPVFVTGKCVSRLEGGLGVGTYLAYLMWLVFLRP